MTMRLVRLAIALGWLVASTGAHAQGALVAAAADLKFVLPEIVAAYRATGGAEPKFAFGSSGNFTQQIENGAPFELFLSADESYVQRLAARGYARDAGMLYALGRIALFVPQGSPLAPDGTLGDLRAALAAGRVSRFAIPNPEHAPYGRAAREALQSAGLWEAIAPTLVLGENASQATQFAAGGGAQGGIIPYPLARAPEVARLGRFALLPESSHRPLRQTMVLLSRAGPEAATFYRFLASPAARAIFVRHGFALPGEG